MARLDLVRRSDEAVFRNLDLPDRTRAKIRIINGIERRARFLSGQTADGEDPSTARQEALERLLGPDELKSFQAAEAIEEVLLKSQREAQRAASDAGVQPVMGGGS
jgi:hypothetical protein